MNSKTDKKLDRILEGKPELANTLHLTQVEGTRRAISTGNDHIVCMDKQAGLHIRICADYKEEESKLTPLTWCFSNGRRSDFDLEKGV